MQPIIRYPNTEESHRIFAERMLTPDLVTSELTKDDVKNLDVVWNTIKDLAPKWMERKKAGIRTPNYPINRKDYWTEYSKLCKPTPFYQLDQFLDNTFPINKTAIDIGCGPGDITKKLLECGWNVIAIDPCMSALKILEANNPNYGSQLTLICKSITKYTPEHPVDLVVCKDVFCHLNPSKFQAVWKKIYHIFLKKNGFLMGTIHAADEDPSKLVTINRMKDIGAWFVPDRRFIIPILEGTGYKVEKTYNSIHAQIEEGPRLVFQFKAQKI